MNKPINQVVNNNTLNNLYARGYNSQYLNLNNPLDYKAVENIHGIKLLYSGRGINVTNNEIVLISTIKKVGNKFIYHDNWINANHYHYLGEGSKGNQTNKKRNMEIINAKNNNKKIILYVKFSSKEYFYQGVMDLESYNIVKLPDRNNILRDAYSFILKK